MIEAWRIDSIDARAGLAFASWRIPDLELDRPDLDRPAVFLSPPFFQPEALTGRAIGFSAARGRAQLGVFVGGAELSFDTLDDLAEFVRRIYVGSGSGDAGGGGPGLPPAPVEPRSGVPPGGLGIDETRVFGHPVVMAARGAASDASRLVFEAGWPVQTKRFDIGDDVAEQVATTLSSPLVDGATEVLLELLRRFPAQIAGDALETWSRSAQSLGTAISRLHLWADIMNGPYGDQLGRLIAVLVPRTEEAPPPLSPSLLLPAIFGAIQSDWAGSWNHGDPVDDLALWPLPADINTLLRGSPGDDASAFGLICAINASPAVLGQTPPLVAIRAFSITLFAAAHLLAEPQPLPRNSWLLPAVRSGARRTMTRLAGEWLFQEWGKIIFPALVEQTIREAAVLTP